ncbi:MAG: S8 family serine peptidase [Lachnospiraceae bacterium]
MKKKAVIFGALITALVFSATSSSTLEAAPGRVFFDAQNEQKTKEIYKEGQALVLYKSNTVSSKKSAQDVLNMGNEIRIEKLWTFENPDKDKQSGLNSMSAADGLSIGLVSSNSLTTKQLVEKLKKEDNVETAEPNYRLHALSTSDAYYEKQWALENNGQNGGTEENSTNISEKWKETKGSDEVVVAVVDTGIDYTHEDLRDNIWENTYQPSLKGEHGFDFINGDGDPMDDNGHGSHCAGIIGARGDNDIGISGVNQNVKIMALKILDEEGYGYGSDEVNAYHYINKALNLGVNVVAVNNSWGGGEESEIFEKLMNLVGEKGAVSVCAAGNESCNNDEVTDYPSGYESPYKIVVAASNENGELASFSNFGKQTVDIAAPGTDILSTVSYNCYNPSLYDEQKQKTISEKFNDFEGNVSEEIVWDIIPGQGEASFFNSDNTKDTEGYKAEISSEKYFGEKGGKSLKLSFGTLESGEFAGIRIPYSISAEKEKENPVLSMMINVNGPVDSDEEGIFAVVDVPEGTKIENDMKWLFMIDNGLGVCVNGEEDDWTHFNVTSAEMEETPAQDRELWMFFMAGKKGEYSVYLDDIGMSSEEADESEFGKYDFYSGTSMAAPFVTGALALESAGNPEATTEEKIDNVLSYVRESEKMSDKVAVGGTLDFGRKVAARPRIGDVSVSVEKGQIQLKGSGLDAEDLEVQVVKDGEIKTADIVGKSKASVTITDDGWINRIVTIVVTGNGKTSTKKDVYLVKGKSGYTAVKDMEFPMSDIMTTNGSNIYIADSLSDTIDVIDTTDPEYMEYDTLFYVNPEKYFKKDAGSLGEYDFTFGKDLVYMDGKLYNVVAFSEVYEGNYYEDDEEDYTVKSSYEEDYDDEDPYGGILSGVAYSSQYKLLCFDPVTETIRNLGELPADIRQTEDWTLTSYNGKLYLIGGYDYKQKEFSRTVKIYNPSTRKWTNGPSLPEGRTGGKAIQNGNCLIYTLGAGTEQKGVDIKEQICPYNLVLRGNRWSVSKERINPYVTGKPVVYGENSYNIYNASVGLCAEGLIYSGTPTEGLGDTFIYNVKKDRYQATKYSQIKELTGETTFTGIAVGSTLYGYDQNGETYKLKINSGLLSVSAKKASHGKIVNTNKKFLPGTAVKLTAKPVKGYIIKSFLINGKKVKGRTVTVRLNSNMSASARFGKAVSKIRLNKTNVTMKAGKTFKLKVKITPKNAVSKKVTYHSSNEKYASVSSKGVIKAKKAGKGKKVVITVKAADGSGKKAKCTVYIK